MPVTLPHDWLIYDTYNLYENGEGWYRTGLEFGEVPAKELVSLRFEGVYMNSTLYVNGQVAGEWKYGYSTFEFDITPYLTAGRMKYICVSSMNRPIPAGTPAPESIGLSGSRLRRRRIWRQTGSI